MRECLTDKVCADGGSIVRGEATRDVLPRISVYAYKYEFTDLPGCEYLFFLHQRSR